MPKNAKSLVIAGDALWLLGNDGTLWAKGRSGLFDPTAQAKSPLDFTSWTKVAGLPKLHSFAAGPTHACAVRTDGRMMCWGSNFGGSLGKGPVATQRLRPLVELDTPSSVRSVHVEGGHTVAVTEGGDLYWWGIRQEAYWQEHTPVRAPKFSNVNQVDIGRLRGCAVVGGGALQCFGVIHGRMEVYWPSGGKYGEPGPRTASTDGHAIGGVDHVVHFSAGADHACAVTSTNHVLCWGAGGSGELGNGRYFGGSQLPATGEFFNYFEKSPVEVKGLDDAIEVQVVDHRTCALHRLGEVSCWGYNRDGSLGSGDKKPHAQPVKVDISEVTHLLPNRRCLIRKNDELWCMQRDRYALRESVWPE